MKKITSIFIIIYLFLQVVYAQNYQDKNYYLIDSLTFDNLSEYDHNLIDSSMIAYYDTNSDTAKINVISFLAEECWDEETWPKYNKWVFEITKTRLETNPKDLFYLNKHAGSLNNIGYYYGQIGDIKKALTYYTKALKIVRAIGDQNGIASTLNNIGYIFLGQGQIEEALVYFHKSLVIEENLKNSKGIAITLNNIGYIYEQQDQFDVALEYYKKSLLLYEEIGDKEGVSISLNSIGIIYNTKENLEKALEYFEKALLIRRELNTHIKIATSLNNIGAIYEQQGHIDSAIILYQQSLKIYEEYGDKSGTVYSLNNIGGIYIEQGEKNKAKYFLKKALNISLEIGSPGLISTASKYLAQLAVLENNYKYAYEMYTLHIVMRDSVNNLETQKITIQKQSKFEYEIKKEIDEIAHNSEMILQKTESEKVLAIEKEKKNRQKLITYGVLGVFSIVVLFLIIMFNRLNVIKKQKIKIEKQSLLVEEQKAKVELAYKETEFQKAIIEETHREITDSINYAKRLQDAILPSFAEINSNFDNNFILFQPKEVVSGDFYWTENKRQNGENVLFIAAADCTGHGVPGALVSVVCSNALNRAVNEFGIFQPSKILDKTREIVITTFAKSGADIKDGMDIALCAFSKQKLLFSGANNPLWIIRDKQHLTLEQNQHKSTFISEELALIEYKGDKQPIGLYEKNKPFTEVEVALFKNDIVYIFTDGFADQFGGGKGKKLKKKAFKELLIKVSKHPLNIQKKIICESFIKWKGSLEQIDDVCIIGVKPQV